MLDLIYGWYVREVLKGHATSIVYEVSLAAGDTGSLAVVDAIDGLIHAADLKSSDYIIYEAFAYADPGFVQLDILPDNSPSRKVRVNATNQPSHVNLVPPLLAEVDMFVNYANEGQPNNVYLSLSALKLPESSIPRFTVLSENVVEMIPLVNQLKEANFNLQNIVRAVRGEDIEGYTGTSASTSAKCRNFCGFGRGD